jgi:hypothetical protein
MRGSLTLVALGTLLVSACGPAPAPSPAPLPAAGGEHAVMVIFKNELGNSFRPERLEVALDGQLLFMKAAETGLAEAPQLVLARDLPLPAGAHVLTLQLVLRGHGHGVFAYLKDYKFTVRSSHEFQARHGLVITIRAHALVDAPIDKRPAVRFEESLR